MRALCIPYPQKAETGNGGVTAQEQKVDDSWKTHRNRVRGVH